jgi:hypothetical protein
MPGARLCRSVAGVGLKCKDPGEKGPGIARLLLNGDMPHFRGSTRAPFFRWSSAPHILQMLLNKPMKLERLWFGDWFVNMGRRRARAFCRYIGRFCA